MNTARSSWCRWPMVTATSSLTPPWSSHRRITVSDIAIWHERMGMSPDEIVSEYPTITLSDVHAALAYYFDHRHEVDQDIREGVDFAEKLRAGAPSIFGTASAALATLFVILNPPALNSTLSRSEIHRY